MIVKFAFCDLKGIFSLSIGILKEVADKYIIVLL